MKKLIHITLFLALSITAALSQESKPADIFKANINTPTDEFYPTLSGDGTSLVYASTRGDGKTSNLYISANVNGQWDSPADLEKINSSKNDVTPFMSFDGSMIVFSSDREVGDSGKKSAGFDLYVSFKVDNQWIEPVKLSDDVNTGDNESAPSLSKDNNVLYFTRWPANQPEKSRIYRATLSDNGFSNVEELPKIINSGNSEFSFVPSKKREGFYFASKRPGGYGSWDIYFVYYKLGSFGNPVNLGQNVNSEKDDLYVAELDDDRIYFSSNREGGAGSYDLYSTEIPHEFGESGSAVGVEKKDEKKDESTDKKETGFNFKISEIKTGSPLSIEFELKLKSSSDTDNNKKTVFEKSDSSGMLSLITDPEISEVTLKSLSGNHQVFSKTYKTENGVVQDIIVSLEQKKKLKQVTDISENFDITPLDFKPIYFESNSTRLKLEYVPYLYGIVNYLRKNENARLEIIGHSGLIGNCKIRNKVSLERAHRVRDYIVSFGINRERLLVKGLGGRFPVDSKYNEVNRRVEFQVVE